MRSRREHPDNARAYRLTIADPARTGAGLTSLLIVHGRHRKAEAAFAAFARGVRQSVAADPSGQFAALAGHGSGRVPVLLTSEQAVWAYQRARPADPAVAVYPREGTLALDYPVALLRTPAARRCARRWPPSARAPTRPAPSRSS